MDGLMQQIAQLQDDLQKAVACNQQFRHENEQLSANFDELKARHMQLQSQHSQTRQAYVAEMSAREHDREQKEELMQRWQQQLHAKQREWEELGEALVASGIYFCVSGNA